jgi:hypothetical protein
MFSALAESTWGVPAIGALHVLLVALFAGAVLADDASLHRMRRLGAVLLAATGTLLLAANPERTLGSLSFRIKMALLLALLFVRGPRWLRLAMWAAVIGAARGVAYL